MNSHPLLLFSSIILVNRADKLRAQSLGLKDPQTLANARAFAIDDVEAYPGMH